MSKTDLPVLEITLQKTHIWLNEITTLMHWSDSHLSYLALRAVLHALRDRLPIEVTAKLGAQLPILIRGIFYEGWVPAHTPIKIHHIDDFIELVSIYLGNDLLVPLADLIVRNVFNVIKKHISEGEIEHIKKVLPQSLNSLWQA